MPDVDPERAWLERELAELRTREAQYRERLGRHGASEARLQAHAEAMHQLFRRRPPSRKELLRTLCDVARISAQALGIQRSSVWCFDAAAQHLRCVTQLVDGVELSVDIAPITCASCPAYVRALSEESALAVQDVYEDARTQELAVYLREHHIGALLDIPVVIPGELLGVVCHEHVGGRRTWERSEIVFASNVAHLVALALETERRMDAEIAARGAEAKYQHLVESLPVTVYSFDVHTGKLDYVSPRVVELGDWSAETWLAQGADAWVERIVPEDRAPVLRRFELGTSGGFAEEITYRIRVPDGSTRWIRDTCHVVRDHAGLPLAMQGVLADVTAQQEARLSLLEFERRYRALIENVDVIAVTLDTLGRVTFANDAFVRLTGFTRAELIGFDWFEKVVPQPVRNAVRQRFLDDVSKGAVVTRFEMGIVTRSGETRQLLASNTLLRANDGTPLGTASLALDVTERRKLEGELLQHTKLEGLGRLAAGVAHDFNNLLTVMLAEVAALKQIAAGSSPDAQEPFAAVDQAIEQAIELTRSLLLYGRKQASRDETLAIDDVIRDALPLLEAVMARGLLLSTSLHAATARLTLDRARLRQVLVNLVGNASDATVGHGKSVRISTHLELIEDVAARAKGAASGGEFVVLTVADDGAGMDASTLARIFDPFFTTKPDGRGTGLGLAVAQTVVDQAGGYILVESSVGAGSSFRVHFPLHGRSSRAKPLPAFQADAAAMASARVLVVEDVRPIREIIADLLRAAGYEVFTVADTRTASEVLSSTTIDLLITDLHLPDGSGNVLARSARSVHPNLRIVLMSGSRELDDDAFDGVIEKPFDDAQLLRVVRNALAGG